eukprot:CAMPEP_0117665630 /NCGR_PEP_ID=MMETSP0804-20121206/9920_1 /TAXON_ID=1074897 /ORGANISM="Tetraselmis astigmatica, Strain CCMP880" /LENGTH=201 /DNA_ID=CAMNT_0005473071 /DNA_START=590 /DNA_END=1198 /DNA_ORIENTATION=+
MGAELHSLVAPQQALQVQTCCACQAIYSEMGLQQAMAPAVTACQSPCNRGQSASCTATAAAALGAWLVLGDVLHCVGQGLGDGGVQPEPLHGWGHWGAVPLIGRGKLLKIHLMYGSFCAPGCPVQPVAPLVALEKLGNIAALPAEVFNMAEIHGRAQGRAGRIAARLILLPALRIALTWSLNATKLSISRRAAGVNATTLG